MYKIAVVLKADRFIGTGHLLRVNGILNYLKENCNITLFATSLDPELLNFCNFYNDIKVLNAQEIISYINKIAFDLVIIDHYFLNKDFEIQIKPPCKVFVIDDLANRSHYCQVLLDQGLLREKEDYKDLVNKDCKLLIGSKYSLVKDAFFNLNKDSLEYQKEHILVSFGGADPAHACLITLNSILKAKLYTKHNFTFLCGAANHDFTTIKMLAKDIGSIKVIQKVSDVSPLLNSCTLAIGAYGGMFNERIAAKIPSLCAVIADNQEGAPIILKKYTVGLDISLKDLSDAKLLTLKLEELSQNKNYYIKECSKVFDGNGLNRICNEIYNLLGENNAVH